MGGGRGRVSVLPREVRPGGLCRSRVEDLGALLGRCSGVTGARRLCVTDIYGVAVNWLEGELLRQENARLTGLIEELKKGQDMLSMIQMMDVTVFTEDGTPVPVVHTLRTERNHIRVVISLSATVETVRKQAVADYQRENQERLDKWSREWEEQQARKVKWEAPELKIPELPLPPAALTERKDDGTA